MDNLHFIPNNILTKFFKELIKYKNDYQQYLNYIFKNYIIYIIVYLLSINLQQPFLMRLKSLIQL